MLFAAAIWTDRLLVRIATISFLAFSLPHFVYHSLNLEPYDGLDAVGNVVSLLFIVLAPAVVLAATFRRSARESP